MKTDSPTMFTVLLARSCNLNERQFREMIFDLKLKAEVSIAENSLAKETTGRTYDAIVAGEEDFEALCLLADKSPSAVLLLIENESRNELKSACIRRGILAARVEHLPAALPMLMASCVRLRTMRDRTDSLQKRLDDTKLVNRAKLLLMSRLHMSESQSHRYIEKTAMDSGESKREVAMGIIRAYEE